MHRLTLFLSTAVCFLGACASSSSLTQGAPSASPDPDLTVVAEAPRQLTGVAVSREGRVFVNFPRWSDDVPVSVAEVMVDGTFRPYPDATWNQWQPGKNPREHFVCVQSVYVDGQNRLWILDPGNPKFAGVVHQAPKLLQIDLTTNTLTRMYPFDASIASNDSYLNDIRIDTDAKLAFMTDSGDGAIVVLNLETGEAQRLLDDHPSTEAQDISITINGQPWLRNGSTPQIHSDGIALDTAGGWLYYQALTGRTLFRVPTLALTDPSITPTQRAAAVEAFAEVGPSDGLLFGQQGEVFLSSLEENAVRALYPDKTIRTIAQSPMIAWPDSFAQDPGGRLYVTSSQIHFGDAPPAPYRVLRLNPSEAPAPGPVSQATTP